MKRIKQRRDWLILGPLALLCLAGCTANQGTAPQPVSPSNLQIYSTATNPVTPQPTTTATLAAIPSSTPVLHTITTGDTLIKLSQRYGLTLGELMSANPGIQPEALVVGQTLLIPAVSSAVGSLSTPVAASLGAVACYPSAGGLYCFAPVQNPLEVALENVQAQITLFDSAGQAQASQTALLPLNSLPAGETLPAMAFFPAVSSSGFQQAHLSSAIQASTAGERYLPARVQNLLAGIDWGGRSATVQGQVFLPADSKPAAVLWLAGVAYDAQGALVGARRWEWAGRLAPGGTQAFIFSIYSAGPPINKVDVIVEARP